MKKLICALLALTIILSSIASCTKIDIDPNGTPIFTPSPVATPTPIDMSAYACSLRNDFYDITTLAEHSEMSLYYAAFYDSETLFLLYISDDGCNYCLCSLSITYGTQKTLYTGSFSTETNDGSGVYFVNFDVISLKPFAFIDMLSNELITISETYTTAVATPLPASAYEYSFFSTNSGSVFAFNGVFDVLYRIDMTNGEFVPVMALDYNYTFVTMLSITDDEKYATFQYTDTISESDEIYSLIYDIENDTPAYSCTSDYLYLCNKNDGYLCYNIDSYEDNDGFWRSTVNEIAFSSFAESGIPIRSYVFTDKAISDMTINTKNVMFSSYISETTFSICYGAPESDYMYDTTIDTFELNPDISYDEDIFDYITVDDFSFSEDGKVVLRTSLGTSIDHLYLQYPSDTYKLEAGAAGDFKVDALITPIAHAERYSYGEEIDTLISEIEAEFGVIVLVGKNAVLTSTNYTNKIFEKEDTIFVALRYLQDALSQYPTGFFETLKENYLRGIIFMFCGSIHAKDTFTLDNPAGYAHVNESYQYIVFDTNAAYAIETTAYHEISHMIDHKLDDFMYSDNAPENFAWSDVDWQTMNPEGFTYYNEYVNSEGEPVYTDSSYTPNSSEYHKNKDVSLIYFVDEYSKTFPTEDRARIMETIMPNNASRAFMKSEHMQAKLAYLAAAIRIAFDPDGLWETPPVWEQRLSQLAD